jgi:hypothetical protein
MASLKFVRSITDHLIDSRNMRLFCNGSFDPQTLVVLEAAFDEAWLTLKAIGNDTVKPDELARCVLRVAMEARATPGVCTMRRCWGSFQRPIGGRPAEHSRHG